MKKLILIFSFFFVLLSKAEEKKISLSFCIPVDKIDFNPFRPINDGKDLGYLMLLRSYISTDGSEPGILSQYEFSPDGKTFTGRVDKDAKWSNGDIVTSFEAALGIAKTLNFRLLGERVSILGTEAINNPGWSNRKYEGIEIIDQRTFKLKLKTQIENIQGVFREALSTNSRHNRFWPIKIKANEDLSNPEVLFKDKYVRLGGAPGIEIQGYRIAFTNKKDCVHPDFSIFPEVFSSLNNLVKRKSPNSSAITLQLNTTRLSLVERKNLSGLIRSSFQGQPEDSGVQQVNSFFLPGEPGYNQQLKWQNSFNIKKLGKKKFIIAYEIPIYKKIIEDYLKLLDLNFELVQLPSNRIDIDAQVLASGMIEGRHVILQDVLKWPHVKEMISGAPKTLKSLSKIAVISASTLPPDLQTLQGFEKNANEEFSLVPIARRYPTAFSNQKISFCLSWNKTGELKFQKSDCQ